MNLVSSGDAGAVEEYDGQLVLEIFEENQDTFEKYQSGRASILVQAK